MIDNDFIATYPSLQLERGNFVRVPLLIGSNTDEGTTFGASFNVSTDEEFEDVLENMGIERGGFAGRVVKLLYPDVEAIGTCLVLSLFLSLGLDLDHNSTLRRCLHLIRKLKIEN